MQEKSEPNTFYKIIEQGNNLLEAGVIEEALQFRLTVTESVDVKNIYIGKIRSLEEHMKLKESFSSFEEVLELIRDPKNVKISLDDMSVTLVSHFGRMMIEVAKIMLKKSEQEVFGPVSLDKIINRCNSKGQLDNYQIKRSFEILAKQVMQLKQQQRTETFESLKEEILGKIDQQNYEMEKKHENFQQRQSNQIKLLKKEIEFVNANNETQLTHVKELQKGFEENKCSFESSLKIQVEQLRQELRNLNQCFIEEIQEIKLQKKSNSIQNIDDMSDKSVSQYHNKSSAEVILNLKEPNVGKQDELQSVIVRCNQEFELKVRQTKTFFKILAEKMFIAKLDHQNTTNVFRKEIEDLTSKSKKQENDFVEFQKIIETNIKKIKEQHFRLSQQYQNQRKLFDKQIEAIKTQSISQITDLQNQLRKEISVLNNKHVQQRSDFKKFQNEVSQGNKKTNQNHKQFSQKSKTEFLSLKSEIESMCSQTNIMKNSLQIVIKESGQTKEKQSNQIKLLKKEIESMCSQINTLKNNLQVVIKESGQTKEKQSEFSTKCEKDFGLFLNSIKNINAQNGKLKTDFDKLHQKIEQNWQKCSNIENGFKTKTVQLSKETKSLNDAFNNTMKIIQTIKKQNSKQFQKTQIIQQKMVYLNYYIQKQKQIQQQKLKLLKQKQIKQKQQKQKQKYYQNIKLYQSFGTFKQFTFDGKTLTKLDDSQTGKVIVFFEQVPFQKQFKFHIKIVKSKDRYISIGIWNYKQYKQNNSGIKDEFCYWANNGNIHPDVRIEGEGVKVGETVEVIVNRDNKTIKWLINGVQIASTTNEILGDKDRQFFPYVAIRNKQDTIEVLMQ